MSKSDSDRDVVFIDSRVPDLQTLLDGLVPGEQAFVLDPSRDGVQQIADILAANNLIDLPSISIVGHGAAGEIDLGSSVLDDADLSEHAFALSQIGSALAPNGDLQLFASNTASRATGKQFIADLSRAANANMAGSTHDIDATPSGENWTRDMMASPTSQVAIAQAAVEAGFSGTPAQPITEPWIAAMAGGAQNLVLHDDDAGTHTASNVGTPVSANNDVESLSPRQVVFIDSKVPDIQDLLNGLAPGEVVFVLDAKRDGVTQIADILAANHFSGLTSISIVGHGAPGAIDLGSTVLDDADLSGHSAALAQIGAALAPGSDLQLYACDVANSATGQQFIADLSRFIGGASVAAATHDIGLTTSGENWTLDASTGTTLASVNAPFTADAMANFQGMLAGTTLAAGDIAITGYNSDDPDTFSFVVLKPIAAGTVINFTDKGWLSSGGFSNFANDSTVTFTASGAIATGTVILSSDSQFSGSLNLDAAGDQIIAYQGSAATPTLLYAINFDNSTTFDANATNANRPCLPGSRSAPPPSPFRSTMPITLARRPASRRLSSPTSAIRIPGPAATRIARRRRAVRFCRRQPNCGSPHRAAATTTSFCMPTTPEPTVH
jgi:hypothetical protein